MNYVNSLSIYGFMNKNCYIDDNNCLAYWKTKSKSQYVQCIHYDKSLLDSDIKKISYMYLDENPMYKGSFMMEQITSNIDKTFIKDYINRQNHREIYESIRKYDSKIEVIKGSKDIIEKHYDEIIEMIKEWQYAEYGGMKYMWQERAGVDKSFFARYINSIFIQNNISIYLFFHKELENKLIGYSIMPNLYNINEYNIPEFSYMLRKCILKNENVNLRNITLYIDWWTFNETMKKFSFDNIAINWGCSSGGVKAYKENKWPVLYKENKWFLNIKLC